MGDCVEGEAQELPVPIPALRCPKCKGYAGLASMVLDVRRVLSARLYQCDECGMLVWNEGPDKYTGARERADQKPLEQARLVPMKIRPDVATASAAGGADETRLKIR